MRVNMRTIPINLPCTVTGAGFAASPVDPLNQDGAVTSSRSL